MNLISKLFAQFTKVIPQDVDSSVNSRERDVVMRLSKGNVRLQFGMYETEQDLARKKASILEHKFI
ncbi:hypothetical protein [Rhodoferax sp.]|uniref:hypothetical protein n=1 Tax=Rhodoferax sp. TaxID=50421 RepID=UPI003BB49FCD